MQIRFLGFRLTCNGKLTTAQLFNYVNQKPASKYGAHERLVRIEHSGGYYIGLAVSMKDQKHFCEIENKALEISVRELEKGRSLIDFNFFVVNAKTGRGLYQHYFHSWGLHQFEGFLHEQLTFLTRDKVAAAITAAEQSGEVSEAKKKAIKKEFKTDLAMAQMVKKEDLPELLDELDRVKRFRMTLATVEPDDKLFQPVSGYVKTRKTELVFNKDANQNAIKKGLLSVVKHAPKAKGAIVGVDENGIERVLNLLENYEAFGNLDYDAVAPTMKFKISEFHKSDMTKRLLAAIKDNKAMFEAEEA